MKKRNLVIIIFPYLFIYEKKGFEAGQLKIKSSWLENIENEKKEIENQLLNIAKLFKFGKNQSISKWSYSFSYVSNYKQWDNLRDKINRLSTILRFSQLNDLKEGSQFEQFNYFIFEITNYQLKTKDKFLYYQGILNGESSFNFHLHNGDVQSPYIPQMELHPLTLTIDQIKENNYFKTFYSGYENLVLKDGEDKKILRAIEWFNRSYSHYGRGVDLSEAILNVHTAIEAMLRPEEEGQGVKAQIKTALSNILGHSKELSLWFDKFWKLRNSIVHGDVKPEPLLYIHPEGRRGHRPQLYIARKIFVKCLDTILKIRTEFPLLGIEDELISNEIRICKTTKLINKQKNSELKKIYETGLFEFISGLRNDDVSASKLQTKQLGELLLPLVKKDLQENEHQNVKKTSIRIIDQILNWKGKNFNDLSLLYSKLLENYKQVYFNEASDLSIYILSLRGAAYHFFDFATWRLLYFN